MANIPYRKLPGTLVASAALIALLGLGAARLTLDEIARHEGYVPEAYRDPVGIWTKCFGDTQDVTPGAAYTFDECLRSLNGQVLAHATPLFRCIPSLADQPDTVKAAMVSMAYNIGTGAFCASSVARSANAGDWEGACRRMAHIYKTAGGKELPGLAQRRKGESELCLHGVREGE